MSNKDIKKLVRELKKTGNRVEEDRRHYVVFGADGLGKVTISKTPSGQSWKKRVESDLKRELAGRDSEKD